MLVILIVLWVFNGFYHGPRFHGLPIEQLDKEGFYRTYILKVEVLEVRTPQIIWIFRKIMVWERKNYQLCSVEFCRREQKL